MKDILIKAIWFVIDKYWHDRAAAFFERISASILSFDKNFELQEQIKTDVTKLIESDFKFKP